jgi:sec-independent protein translocase protein TatA
VDFGPPEILIVLVVVLVLFGGAQLPKLAKNLGKAQREFKAALEDAKHEAAPAAEPVPADEAPPAERAAPVDALPADDDHPAHTD